MGTSQSAQAVRIQASRPVAFPLSATARYSARQHNETTDAPDSLIPPSRLRGLGVVGGGGGARRQKYLLSLDRSMKVFLRASNLPGLEYRLRLAGYHTFNDLLSTDRETLEARGFTGIMARRLMNAVSEYIRKEVYRTEEERLPFRLVRRGKRLQKEPSESMKENPNYRKQNLKRLKSSGEDPGKNIAQVLAGSGPSAAGVKSAGAQVRLMTESDLELQHLLSPPPPPTPPPPDTVASGSGSDELREGTTVEGRVGDGVQEGTVVEEGGSGDDDAIGVQEEANVEGGSGGNDTGEEPIVEGGVTGGDGDGDRRHQVPESDHDNLPPRDDRGRRILGVIVKHDGPSPPLPSSSLTHPLEEPPENLITTSTSPGGPEETDFSANHHDSLAPLLPRSFSVPADFELSIDEETTDCLVVTHVRSFSDPALPSSPSDHQHTQLYYEHSWHTY